MELKKSEMRRNQICNFRFIKGKERESQLFNKEAEKKGNLIKTNETNCTITCSTLLLLFS